MPTDEYKQMSIKSIVSKIEKGELFLPAIQRHFVWTPEKIENLFDSIMLGYPIGTFLFWTVSKEYINENKYSIYRYIQDYHERDRYLNERVGDPITHINEITAVLDGQQRISSMFMALKGSVAFKKPKARKDNDSAYPAKQLYLNLIRGVKKDKTIDEISDDENSTFEFRFLSDDEYYHDFDEEKNVTLENRKHVWFLVKQVMAWSSTDDITTFAISSSWIQNSIIMGNLWNLWNRICEKPIINYFEVINNNLDDVLDIFVRVNSGGVILSKTDLLFSTIVSHWDDARDEFEKLLIELNKIGDHFCFNNDFLMRTCLVLTDSPVLFKVDTFKQDNIQKIKNGWSRIKEALKTTVTMISEFGFNGENLLSQNAIIPIAYFVFNSNGKVDDYGKKEIKKYLISSLLKKVFSSKGDSVLRTIRSNMRTEVKLTEGLSTYKLKINRFDFSMFNQLKLPGDHKFILSDDDIEELFLNQKDNYTFMILSLLYPQFKWNATVIHQDHIHPYSNFSTEKLKANGVKATDIHLWQSYASQLPNLELLCGNENQSKNDSQFKDWISKQPNKAEYMKLNYIPNVSFEFSNFMEFFLKRKELMKKELKKALS